MSKAKTKKAWADLEILLESAVPTEHRHKVREAVKAIVETKKRGATTGGGNDLVMTPDSLSLAIVRHFRPRGIMCDPCQGTGAFVRAFDAWIAAHTSKVTEPIDPILQTQPWESRGHDITDGIDFLTMVDPDPRLPFAPWNWIITNPPWSQFVAFLKQAMVFADNVVFLDKYNAWGFTGRLRIIEEAGFEIIEKAKVKQPKKPWPQMGMQLAAVHLRRLPRGGTSSGLCKETWIDWTP